MLTRRTLLRAALIAAAGATVPGCGPPAKRGARRPVEPSMPFERVAYGPAPQQFGELRRPSGVATGLVVVVHGGFWNDRTDVRQTVPLSEALTRDGFATWNIEYRRLGNQGGGWPGTFLDVAAAVDQLKATAPQYGLDPRRVVALGHSAGGQLALWCAGRRWIREGDLRTAKPLKLRGAVALAGIVDLRRAYDLGIDGVGPLMGGGPAEVPYRYDAGDPVSLLPLGVPQVLIVGGGDTVVPAALNVRYQREAKQRGDDATLVTLPGVGHGDLIDPAGPAYGTVREGLRELLV